MFCNNFSSLKENQVPQNMREGSRTLILPRERNKKGIKQWGGWGGDETELRKFQKINKSKYIYTDFVAFFCKYTIICTIILIYCFANLLLISAL